MPLNQLNLSNVNDWLDYISHLHHKEMDFGLSRILAVVQPLKWHIFSCPVIIVGGTNGKGSCVRLLENIYSAAGYRVGAFTSPHLMSFNERIRIANNSVDDIALMQAFQQVENARGSISLSFFEYTFLAGLQIFQQSHLDLLVLEVGLGGRLDAVNIVDGDIAVITTIDLDHTDLLGPDRESIAFEKAGIFRAGKPVICGDPKPPGNLRKKSAELMSPWYALDENFHYEMDDFHETWQWWSARSDIDSLPGLTLKHQNAATSLMAVELLQSRLPVTKTDLRTGLAKAKLAGRFEKITFNSNHFCYVDVAHNPQGGRWLAEQWQNITVNAKRIAILGMLADKDIAGTVESLLHYVDQWYLVTLSVSRGATAEQLQDVMKKLGVNDCCLFKTVEHALQAALKHDVILVFGSFHTVAAARRYLMQGEDNARYKRTIL